MALRRGVRRDDRGRRAERPAPDGGPRAALLAGVRGDRRFPQEGPGQAAVRDGPKAVPQPLWGDWLKHPEWSGGEVLDLHVHDLDTLNWLFGTPKTVYTLGQRSQSGGWDLALTLVDYGDVQGFAEGSAFIRRLSLHDEAVGAVRARLGRVHLPRRRGPGGFAGRRGTSLLFMRRASHPAAWRQAGDGYATRRRTSWRASSRASSPQKARRNRAVWPWRPPWPRGSRSRPGRCELVT